MKLIIKPVKRVMFDKPFNLAAHLKSLVGTELGSSDVELITREIDVIKTRAVEKITEKLDAEKAKYKDLDESTKEIREEAEKAKTQKALKEAGLKEDADLKKINLESYKNEDGTIDYKKIGEDFPSFKSESKPDDDGDDEEEDITLRQTQENDDDDGDDGDDGLIG